MDLSTIELLILVAVPPWQTHLKQRDMNNQAEAEEFRVASVISAMGKNTPVSRPAGVEVIEFRLRPALVSKIAIARHAAHPEVAVLFSLGLTNSKVFFMLVDGNEAGFARVLAKLECYDVMEKPLRFGSCFEMNDRDLAKKLGRVAFQILRPEPDGPTTGCPKQLLTASGPTELLWVIPLTEDDLKVSKEKGLEAMLDWFASTERDVVSVKS